MYAFSIAILLLICRGLGISRLQKKIIGDFVQLGKGDSVHWTDFVCIPSNQSPNNTSILLNGFTINNIRTVK